MRIQGKIVDIINREIYNGEIVFSNKRIERISRLEVEFSNYILPGLIDSHVHIESSMLTPQQFSKLVVPRGTVAVVTDPHEIANVMGVKGVDFMIENSKGTPLKCFFGAPSCVPATSFETSGAVINSEIVSSLLKREEVVVLSEMMNYPGVIYEDEEVYKKIHAALQLGKKVDGHAPGLIGDALIKYASAGITSDHECTSVDEAVQKILLGITVQIREGSAAKNFDVLSSLFSLYPKNVMLCTDDSHPDEIIREGHIDKIIKKGIRKGIDIFDLLYAATIKPVEHYGLPVGLLQVGDFADFIVVDSLQKFNILETYINGEPVYSQGECNFTVSKSPIINNFNAEILTKAKIRVPYLMDKSIRVIEVIEDDLLTNEFIWNPKNINGFIESSLDEDILKIVVLNRYSISKPIVGFIKNIGLKKGALACSIAHDSHNLIAVGVSDDDITRALNEVVNNKGGISCVNDNELEYLHLEIAGLMTDKDGVEVAKMYEKINLKAKQLGSPLKAPFMTLSFMSLLVIPKLKIGDRGLFDVESFSFTNLYV